jgi:hypothetical protein
MNFLWDFGIGAVLALLPARWRRRLPGTAEVSWSRAGTMSGIYEMALAIAVLANWYMYEMARRMQQVVEVMSQHPGQEVNEHQVQGAALFLFYMSPLTWVLSYFVIEGAVRLLGAAFSDHVMGTLPLYLAERLAFWIRKPEEARVGERVKGHAKDIAESVREKVMVTRLEDVEDELVELKKDGAEFLEIQASRRKEEWVAPKTVRVGDTFYRLEESWVGSGERPFRYRWRKVEAGVMGRTVIVYR